MKTYHGTWTETGGAVVVNDNGEFRSLDPRHDLRNLSPDGFSWGHGGTGPAQLALALAADVLGNDFQARKVYHRLNNKLIASLPHEEWVLTENRIRSAIEAIEYDLPRAR